MRLVKLEYRPKDFRPKNDDVKWSRKNYLEIPPCEKPFLENLFYFIERRIFAKNEGLKQADYLLLYEQNWLKEGTEVLVLKKNQLNQVNKNLYQTDRSD